MVGWCSIGTFNDPWTTWDLRPSGIEDTCLLLICFLLCWATCREHPRAMMCLFNQIIQIQYDWIQPPKIKVMMMMFISHHCSSIWFLIAIMAQKKGHFYLNPRLLVVLEKAGKSPLSFDCSFINTPEKAPNLRCFPLVGSLGFQNPSSDVKRASAWSVWRVGWPGPLKTGSVGKRKTRPLGESQGSDQLISGQSPR